jgi:enoyl-CoA hydratase
LSIIIEKKNNISTIIIYNPEVRNAIDGKSAEFLANAIREFEADKDSKVAVLWGMDGNFCSGANLKALMTGSGNKVTKEGDGPMGPTRMILSKPIIAAISGYAVAGGLELALWCDLRIIEKNGILGVFNRRWGIPLIDGGTIRLPRIIGLGRALDLILTGRSVDAEEALSMGLVNRIVDVGQSRIEAEKLAEKIAEFPQLCMLHDRMSTYEQFDYDIKNSLENEYEHGLKSLNEIESGLERFNKGEGRHGKM